MVGVMMGLHDNNRGQELQGAVDNVEGPTVEEQLLVAAFAGTGLQAE
jgi:hypothetical protein